MTASKRNSAQGVRALLSDHPVLAIVIIFIFIFGCVTGVATVLTQDGEVIAKYYENIVMYAGDAAPALGASLLRSVLTTVLYVAIILLSGIWLPGIAPAALAIVIKGFIFGMSSGAILHSAGMKDVFVFLTAIVIPEVLLFIPSILLCIASFSVWRQNAHLKLKFGRSTLDEKFLKSALSSAIFFLPYMVFQGIAAPVLVRLINLI
ncbi:MAG: stage II sporulation protein M [Candidatus Gastranaerophilaceae bacterium]|jgi:hypothetical protein|nr:hypothetical protein [Christensenellales bacterium]